MNTDSWRACADHQSTEPVGTKQSNTSPHTARLILQPGYKDSIACLPLYIGHTLSSQ